MKEVSVKEITNMIKLAYVTFSWLEEIKYNINKCLELARSFMKMYNITMFRFNIAKIQS